ncbi:inorganic diphosphatase [Mucilaginibacter sp.]|uniref:inorganic diphosphatase n=1 Tax=Mucilaginibacter sp. TaxID=1882438 RepID=UPI003D11D64A
MKLVTAMVECPRGINHKLEYNPEEKHFRLSKILPAGLTFPFDFGFITDTRGEDGDPLDIIVVSEITSFPGIMIECRIVGSLAALQTERDGKTMRNDRYIGIPVVSQLFSNVRDISDLTEAILNQMEAFFSNYNEQAGKTFKVLERKNAAAAYEDIKRQRFN